MARAASADGSHVLTPVVDAAVVHACCFLSCLPPRLWTARQLVDDSSCLFLVASCCSGAFLLLVVHTMLCLPGCWGYVCERGVSAGVCKLMCGVYMHLPEAFVVAYSQLICGVYMRVVIMWLSLIVCLQVQRLLRAASRC